MVQFQKLLSEDLNSNVELLTENTSSGKQLYIEGIFAQADVVNGNDRIYPSSILMPEFERYINECVKTCQAVGEIEHPDRPQPDLKQASHLITELRIEGSNVYGKARLLPTKMGRHAAELLEGGVRLGVSTRALGSVKTRNDGVDVVQDDFRLFTIDIVGTPSAPDAFVNGLLESVDWKFDPKTNLVTKINRELVESVILKQKLKILKKILL
jgi:hypothetical protein